MPDGDSASGFAVARKANQNQICVFVCFSPGIYLRRIVVLILLCLFFYCYVLT